MADLPKVRPHRLSLPVPPSVSHSFAHGHHSDTVSARWPHFPKLLKSFLIFVNPKLEISAISGKGKYCSATVWHMSPPLIYYGIISHLELFSNSIGFRKSAMSLCIPSGYHVVYVTHNLKGVIMMFLDLILKMSVILRWYMRDRVMVRKKKIVTTVTEQSFQARFC